MPSSIFDSLPYIDVLTTPAALENARALIAEELARAPPPSGTLHPRVSKPSLPPATWRTDALAAEDARLAQNPESKLVAIDQSRYRAVTAPEQNGEGNVGNDEQDTAQLLRLLETSATQSTHLAIKNINLSLMMPDPPVFKPGDDGGMDSTNNAASQGGKIQLADYYRNAFLLRNLLLENELKAAENALRDTKKEIDIVNLARKTAQEEAAVELQLLEHEWKRGVAKVVKIGIATEQLRRAGDDILRQKAAESVALEA